MAVFRIELLVQTLELVIKDVLSLKTNAANRTKTCDVQYQVLYKNKKLLNLYLRVICVVCCTQAEVSIGRTGSPIKSIFNWSSPKNKTKFYTLPLQIQSFSTSQQQILRGKWLYLCCRFLSAILGVDRAKKHGKIQ